MTAAKPLLPAAESDLPEGWALTTISDVTETIPNLNPETAPDRMFGYVDISSICNKTFKITDAKSFRGKDAPSRARRPIKAGDVLFSNVRTYLRNIALVPNNLDAELCSTGFTVLRSNGAIEPELLFYEVLTDRLIDLVTPQQTGSQYPATSDRVVMSATVPVPPLAEQKRIVENVDQLLARVDSARERLGRVPLILKRFRQAVLAAACSGRLTADWRKQRDLVPVARRLDTFQVRTDGLKTRRGVPTEVEITDELANLALPSTWSLQSVASLLKLGVLIDLKDGNHGSNHPKSKDFGDTGLPFITAAQVRDYNIDYDGAPKVTGEPLKQLRVGFAQPGDAILTHKGTVGRAALNTRPCVLTPQTTYYRCKPEILDSRYLVYFFTSPLFYSQLAAVMSQTTRDFVPISEQYRLFFLIPTPAEQHEIVHRIDALFKLAYAIEKRVAAATIRSEKLTQAILAKAFRGELVPTEAELARREGRSYEPASALLDRIRADRESSKAAHNESRPDGHDQQERRWQKKAAKRIRRSSSKS
ncbi:MAG TPA: restriction endonuclease subunit S [Candidatus Dormibacteraeota bacterium]|nr:restriction endonuclease subunit S [Candidatus Dormibacteraeota bacterium]